MKLNYYVNSCPLTLADYPCDSQFVQWLERNNVEGKLIFHFGTGEHHLVGRKNHERGNPNEIIAITASREEHRAYIDFVIEEPIAANFYKVLFADIYTLSRRMLPNFDIVTLFHLCEYYDAWPYERTTADGKKGQPDGMALNSSYARLNDKKVLELFLSRLAPQGKILFFTKSGAYIDADRKAEKLVNDFIYRKRVIVEEEYEALLVCRRPW